MNKETPVISLVIWGTAIACTLVFLFQNLQPLVTVYFLGQFTIPIPLSLAVLAAFLIGGICAFIINLISFWLNPRINSEEEFEETEEDYEEIPVSKSTPKQKPSTPQDNTVRYGSNSSYEDDYDEDDVIDVKYLDR